MAVLVSLTLFMGGCSLVKLKTSAEPTESPGFSDEEIKAFMEGSEVYEEEQDGRPVWAYTKHKNPMSKNYIARIGSDKIGNKSRDEVEDSLQRKLRILLAANVETSVERVIIDSVYLRIEQHGKQLKKIRDHVETVVSRHVSPSLTFNNVYDKEYQWFDENNDTLWYYIQFNRTKYMLEEQHRIDEEIRKAGELAYHYLKTSFNALSENADMEKALTVLGMASYYISKGGGSAYEDDLFNPGNQQNLLVQHRDLISEIKKNIGIKLRNKDEKIVVTRDKPFTAKIVTSLNTKDYDLNRVKLRIRADTDVLNFPRTVNLELDGSVEIPFSSKTDVYGKTVDVSVTFDVSGSIADKEWYKTKYYFDLLKELPGIKEFKIMTEEFIPIKTWALIHSEIPKIFVKDAKFLQSRLESELANNPKIFNVNYHDDWPIDYKKYRSYKSGVINYNDLKSQDREEIQNHDLDIVMEIHEETDGVFALMLRGTNPIVGKGLLSTEISSLSKEDINRKQITNLIQKFVDKYFLRIIKLEIPVKGDLDVSANGEEIAFQEIDNYLELQGLSRFETQELIAKSSGYRKQVFPIPGEPFSFQMTPRPRSSIQMDQLALEHGTLKVSVVDKSTGDPIQYVENIDKSTFFNMFRGGERGLGKPPKIKVRQLWFGFIPNPFYSMVSDTSDSASFSINKPSSVHNIFNLSYVSPKYSVKVSKQFYNPPLLPTIVRVYDDKDPLSKESNYISIPLLKKDKKVAMVRSVIFPGLGHLTLGKNKEGLSFFSSALVTVLGGAYQNNKFKNEVESYNHLKDDYLTAPEENWTAYEHDLNRSKGRIKDHRFWVNMSLATYGAIWGFNLLTVTR